MALNRAVAIAEVLGPVAALKLVDALDLDDFYLYHAIRADLLQRIGEVERAAVSYVSTIDRTGNEAEREHLRRALARLGARSVAHQPPGER